MISAGGGCRDATTARLRSAWGKFCELLPLLTSRRLSLTTHGHLYQSYIRIAMSYGCECWGPIVADTLHLQRNDCIMIRWICNVKLEDHIASDDLLQRPGIVSVGVVMCRNRLRWYCHVQWSSAWIHQVTKHVFEGGDTRR